MKTYDEYMESHDKPMETLEDAILYVTARRTCGTCSRCPVKLYEAGCASDRNIRKACDLIRDGFGWDESDDEILKADTANDILYRTLIEGELKLKQEIAIGTCSACLFSRPHTSGILYCESFGNFVHEDGYCYRFKTPVDNSENF